jgi:hypothetical protein
MPKRPGLSRSLPQTRGRGRDPRWSRLGAGPPGASAKGGRERGPPGPGPLRRDGFPGVDELGIWAAPGGAKVAWFKDPDGNLLSLTEMGSARRGARRAGGARAGRRRTAARGG